MHSDNQSQRTNLKTNLKWPVILKVHVHTHTVIHALTGKHKENADANMFQRSPK